MKIDRTADGNKKKKKRDKSVFEKEFFHWLEASMKSAVDMALDEALREINT